MILHAHDVDLVPYLERPDFTAKVRQIDDFLEWLKEHFAQGDRHAVDTDPACEFADLRFRPSEVTFWAGSNGSRKSMMLSQISLDLARQGEISLTLSLEMTVRRTYERMVRQSTARATPSSNDIDRAAQLMRGYVYLFDHVGMLDAQYVAAVCRWAKDNLDAQHIIVDSMMRCVAGDDNYNGQKDFVSLMCETANQTGQHIHIVGHTRKPSESKEPMPTKWDIKGSSSVSDLAHNVVMLWRNREKEYKIEEAHVKGMPITPEIDSRPDQILDVAKQRNGEFEGKVRLWFDKDSMQFIQRRNANALPYLANQKRETKNVPSSL